ncbi:MAG: tetratricopeptide repeat protein, partial [Phycisphaerales bacterium]|nr:tetratricopeptide repeat protein [Phycisphaerales bacterium]
LQIAGRAYAGLDDYARAEADLRDALRANRSDVEAMSALAEVHELAGEQRRAIQQHEAILELNPLHEASREALTSLYLHDREKHPDGLAQAAAQVAELRRLSASPHRIARCAALVELSNSPPANWDRYRETLRAALNEHGADCLTWTRIGQSYAGLSRIDEALVACQRALEIAADDPEALELAAGLHEVSFEYRDAVKVIERLLERHPRRKAWNERLWRNLMLDHSFDEAYAWATKQLERKDMDAEEHGQCRARAVMALERAERHDEQIALLRRWHAEDETDANVTAWLIDAYASAKRFGDAVEVAAEVYARDTQDRAVREELRTRLLAAEHFDGAGQLLLDAMETDPLDEILMRQLVHALTVAGKHDDALELLDNYAAEKERDDWVFDMRTAILQDARRFSDVLQMLNERLRAAEQSQEAVASGEVHEFRRRIAIALMFAQRFDEAAQKLRMWIEETPEERVRFVFLQLLSQCHQSRGSAADAIEALERAHALAPSDVQSNNDLGYSLTDAGLRIEEAERMIRFALSRAPDNGAYIDSFGWLFYKKGRFDDARLWLKRAVNSNGGHDPVVYDHLGDALWRSGMADEADRQWRLAVELIQDKSNADRPDLKRLLGRVQSKLDARSAGREPETAPLAAPAGDSEGSDRTPPT